jgi:hypothetical protein
VVIYLSGEVEEDGVRMYSVVRVDRDAICDICFQDAPETAELDRTEIYDGGERESCRGDVLRICQGCTYRIGSMFDPHNAGKELFCGALQDAS